MSHEYLTKTRKANARAFRGRVGRRQGRKKQES